MMSVTGLLILSVAKVSGVEIEKMPHRKLCLTPMSYRRRLPSWGASLRLGRLDVCHGAGFVGGSKSARFR